MLIIYVSVFVENLNVRKYAIIYKIFSIKYVLIILLDE